MEEYKKEFEADNMLNMMNTTDSNNKTVLETMDTLVAGDTVVEEMAISEEENVVTTVTAAVEKEVVVVEKPAVKFKYETPLATEAMVEEYKRVSDNEDKVTLNGRRLFDDSDEELIAALQQAEAAAKQVKDKNDSGVGKMQDIVVEANADTVQVADAETSKEKKSSGGRPKTVTQKANKKQTKPKKVSTKPEYTVEEEPEYEIEQIVAHRVYKGKVVKYEIKWKGYGPEENTMESASTIHDDVFDLCSAYWDTITNIPRPANAPASSKIATPLAPSSPPAVAPPAVAPPVTGTKRKRTEQVKKEHVEEASIQIEEPQEEQDVKLNKKQKKSLDHVPQYMLERGYVFSSTWPNAKTKWSIDMKKFSAIQLSPIDKTVRMAYIDWNNGEKTIHTLSECHEKCPEKLINYYEERLRFV